MGTKVLVIEDNPTNMEVLVELLGWFGYVALTAHGGEEGIAVARRERPGLILCDIHLPKMDGYEVLRHLRSGPDAVQAPVVAVTALAMVGDRERLLNAGFDGYVAKPIEPETFVEAIETFLPPALRSTSRPADGAPAVDCAAPVAANGVRILVVDDSGVNRDLVAGTLEPLGYEIIAARNVEEGLNKALRTRVDLILSDVHMPNRDGLSMLREVKAHPVLRSIPFALISSSIGDESANRLALQLGAARLIRRPIEPHDLIEQIRAALEERIGMRA